MKFKNTWHLPSLVIAASTFILIFLQNFFMPLAYDDYGFGSLSYVISIADIKGFTPNGHEHSLKEILAFNYYIYTHHSGRLLCTLLTTVALGAGLPFLIIKLAQSMLIFSFCLFVARLKKEAPALFNVEVFILCLAGYFMLPLKIANDSSMWMTGSITYLWLTIFAVVLIILFARNQPASVSQLLGMSFLYLIVATGHELISLSFCCALTMLFAFDYYINHSWDKQKLLFLLSSLVGYALNITAPGNIIRMGRTQRYASYSLMETALKRVEEVSKSFVRPELFAMVLGLLGALYLLACFQKNYQQISHRLNRVFPTIIIVLGIIYLAIISHLLHRYPFINMLKYTFLILLFSSTGYLALIDALKFREGSILAWAIALLSYNLARLIAPSDVHRILLPGYLITLIFVICILNRQVSNIRFQALLPLTILALANWSYITYGYAANYSVHQENTKILLAAASQIQSGENIKKITLHKFNTTYYPSTPWKKKRHEEVWLKFYYLIPQAVVIDYVGDDVGRFEKI